MAARRSSVAAFRFSRSIHRCPRLTKRAYLRSGLELVALEQAESPAIIVLGGPESVSRSL